MENNKESKKNKKEKNEKKKLAKPGKGIETMYRVSMNSHVQFNKIADNKANILLSVNAIIISVLLTTLLPEFLNGNFLNLRLAFGFILATSVFTMAFAIIATIPKNTGKYIDLSKANTNAGKFLFFGNFHKMSLEEYIKGMRTFQHNDQDTYDALSQNFYILGKALAKKYLYLHIAYRIFLFGFIISVIAFVFALVSY